MGEHKQRSFLGAVILMVGLGASSGIFHKTNFIVEATSGNVLQGVIALLIGGALVIFASIALNQLFATTQHGGLISVFETHTNKRFACGYAWFNGFIATPAITAVLAWVAGIYTLNIFGIEPSESWLTVLIGIGYVIAIVLINVISYKFAHISQKVTTIIKYLPLIVLGIMALIYGDPKAFSIPSPQSGHITTYLGVDNGWFSALAPVAFCYESWWVTCALAKHSGNKHTNKAVVASNLIITAIYVLYFVGISSYGTSIAILGNNHLNSVVSDIFGNIFGKIIMAFVLIAMLGSVDTLVMGLIHMPDIMAGKGYVGGVFADSDDNLDNTSVFGAIFATISVSVWIVLHNLSEELEIFESSVSVGTDFAEIAMIASFSLLIVLYIKVIVQYKKGIITSVFAGIVCPVVAILITLLFVAGAIYNNALPFTICFAICALVFVAGYLYYNSKLKRKGEQGQSARIDEIVDKYIE